MTQKQEYTTKREIWNLSDLKPYSRNAKKHTDKQINKLAELIKENGFIGAITVDENGVILAGHGRRLALMKLGAKKVPVDIVSNMSEQQKRAFRISDNMIARGEHDDEILGKEIAYIAAGGASDGLDMIDLSLLGMEDDEVDDFLSRYSIDDVFEDVESDLLEEVDEVSQEGEQAEERKLPKQVEYQKIYSVVVDCENEAEQKEVYDMMVAINKRCKIQSM